MTEQYVQSALTDLLKVTIDLPEWEAHHKKSRVSRPIAPSTEPRRHRPVTTGTMGKGLLDDIISTSKPNSSESKKASENIAVDEADGGVASTSDCFDEKEDGQEKHETKAAAIVKGPPDTGLWRLLYKGAFVPFPVASFGADLELKGTRISKPARVSDQPSNCQQ